MFIPKMEEYMKYLSKKDLKIFYNYAHYSPKTKNEFYQFLNKSSKTALKSYAVYSYKKNE